MTDRPTLGALRTLVALLLVLGAGVAGAADDAKPDDTRSKWEFDVMPYGWVPGIYGSFKVDGHPVKVNVTPSNVLNLLFDGNAFAAAGYFSVAYERFSLFTDTMGGYAEVRVTEEIPTQLCKLSVRARDKTKFVIGDVGFGYRLGAWTLPGRRRPFTLGVYTGARYMYFSNQLNATAGVVGGVQKAANAFDSIAWADPLLGIRWSVPVVDWMSLDFRGDIGGFGASSDLIWGLASTVRVWLPWKLFSAEPYLAAGYRVVAFDRSQKVEDLDMQFRGPMMGAGFTF